MPDEKAYLEPCGKAAPEIYCIRSSGKAAVPSAEPSRSPEGGASSSEEPTADPTRHSNSRPNVRPNCKNPEDGNGSPGTRAEGTEREVDASFSGSAVPPCPAADVRGEGSLGQVRRSSSCDESVAGTKARPEEEGEASSGDNLTEDTKAFLRELAKAAALQFLAEDGENPSPES